MHSYLGGECDLGAVTQIVTTYSNQPGVSQTLKLSNSNVTQEINVAPGLQTYVANFTGSTQRYGNLALEGPCAAAGANSIWYGIAQQTGGNADGDWFAAELNGTMGEFNINASNPNYMTLEARIPVNTINNTRLDYLSVERITVLKRTHSVSSLALFDVPGTNPMTSEPFQTLMASANSTASDQIMYNTAVALNPKLAKEYSFSTWAGLRRLANRNETSSIGWTNYTYTFT